jgi:iron complex outermembrane receptor protein
MNSVCARTLLGAGKGSALAVGLLITTALVSPAFAAIEIVTVTAEKRVEKNINVPISITVNTAEDIKNKNVSDLTELGDKIPNVNGSGHFAGQFNIRGIATASAGGGFPPDVGVNVDDVFMGRDTAFDTVLSDVSSVEVLRGPQGTLYGKNTIAGVININTNRPTDVYEALGDIRFGNWDYFQARGTVSGPIIDDDLLLRVTGSYQTRGGFLNNVFLNKHQNGLNDFGGHGVLVYKPREDLSFEWRFDGYEQHDTDGLPLETQHTLDEATCKSFPYNFLGCNAAFYASVPPQNPTDRIVETNTIPVEKRGMWGTSLKGQYDFGDGYSLVSITAYRDLNSIDNADQDGSRLDGFDTGDNETFHRFSQEVRVVSPGSDRFNWILGLYVDSELDHEFFHIRVGQAFPTFLFGFPFPKLLPPGFQEAAAANAHIQSDSFAGFASAKYNITDKLSISGGVRYTDEHKSLSYVQMPTLPIQFGVIFAFAEPIPLTHSFLSEGEMSGDANLQYAITPDQIAYFRFAHGFKAGGFESDIISPPYNVAKNGLSFKPEYLDAYEVGFKSVLFDSQLTLNAAAFYYDFSNKQEQINTGVSFVVSNAAAATSTGFELEAAYSPVDVPGLSLFGNIGIVDAYYNLFPNGGGPGINYTGHQLAGSSPVSMSWGGQYIHPLSFWPGMDLDLATDWDYRDRAFGDPANDVNQEIQAFMIINARIGVEAEDGTWGLYAWGRNLGDKTVLGPGVDVVNHIYITRSINIGRTFGLELRGHI